MSYEVTATRRRPQTFDNLVGQEFVAETLKKSITSGKIAHAYLFSGPRGCGKTSSARILAKALNCANGPTDTPCGHCSNCMEITKGASLDVIEIDGASNTGVDNIRQIKEEVMFPPSNCRYKIYIIDEVHMLSQSSFNALLKTIEEPPAHVIFIFATTELQKVPATIKSRCQQFNFRLVAIEKVKNCLAEAAAELNIQADDEALFWIARESTGSMRDAYTLFDQVVAFSDGHITYDKIKDKLGLVGVDRLNSVFESCVNGKSDVVLNLLDEFLQSGVSIDQLISNAADYLRSLLLIKSGITKEALLGNSVERYSGVVLQAWNQIQIERALSIFLQLYKDIRYSLSPRYEVELAFSRLCWVSQYVSNMEVKKAIDAAQALLVGANPGLMMNQNQSGAAAGASAGAAVAAGNGFAAGGSFGGAGVASQAGIALQVGNGLQAGVGLGNSGDFNTNQNAESKPVNKIPNGLPRLSMLDSMEKESAGTDDGSNFGNDFQGEQSHPFYNGGSLPPEQTVDFDGADDEWLDTETPPEEDSYSAEEYENMVLESYENSVGQGGANSSSFGMAYGANGDSQGGFGSGGAGVSLGNATVGSQAVIGAQSSNSFGGSVGVGAQTGETFSLPDGRTLSIAQLRGNVTATLSVEKGFIVAVLEKTGLWKVTDGGVETTIETNLDYSILQKNKHLISEEISKICGKNMYFDVKLQEVQNQNITENKDFPNQVKILIDVFRGTVI